MYAAYWPLLAVWAVLILFTVKRNGKLAGVSSVFFLGSVFGNFVLTFAASYAGRCAWPSLVWLLPAVAVLIPFCMSEAGCGTAVRRFRVLKMLPPVFTACLVLFTAYSAVFGVYDVYRTGRDMRANVDIIESLRDSGETDIEVRCVYPATKYSAIYNLKYLDTETPYIWPNENMANWFGVNSITALP